MSEYRKMTVERLRDLARSLLGPGHSKKTKAELVAALEGAAAKVAGAAAKIAPAKERAVSAGKAARAAAEKLGAAAREGAKAALRAGKAAAAGARAAGRKAAEEEKGARTARKAPARARAQKAAPAAPVAPARGPGGPDPDGYFVARVRGEDAVRDAPHPMTETTGERWREEEPAPAKWDERLGELPWSYGDDAFVALPRDPRTLFLYWDFGGDTLARGFEGLDQGRTQLWIHARSGGGFERVRVLEFAIESRGFYVHDLEPGRTYRAEIHVVDRGGREKLLGAPSNECALPPVGPSSVVDDRFIRIPWDLPLGKLLGPGHPGAPFSDEARAMLARLSDWSRFQGPTWGGSAGGMGGRPFSPTSSPSSPSGGRER